MDPKKNKKSRFEENWGSKKKTTTKNYEQIDIIYRFFFLGCDRKYIYLRILRSECKPPRFFAIKMRHHL